LYRQRLSKIRLIMADGKEQSLSQRAMKTITPLLRCLEIDMPAHSEGI
jgi:hypothetical protein